MVSLSCSLGSRHERDQTLRGDSRHKTDRLVQPSDPERGRTVSDFTDFPL